MTVPLLSIAPLAEQDIHPCAAIMAGSEPWTRYGIDLTVALRVWTGALGESAAVSVARRGLLTCGFAWYISRGAFGLSGYLKLLGVSREARGHGVGSALLAHSEQQALADGHNDLFLLVSDFNEAAQRFYQGHGYTRVGALAGYVHPDIAELIYRKRVRPRGRVVMKEPTVAVEPRVTGVRAIGLISGTSMDGVDAAAVEISEQRTGAAADTALSVTPQAVLTLPYPPEIRAALIDLCRGGAGSALAACRLTMVLGEVFAQAAQEVLSRAGWAAPDVSLIGSHGQTTVSDMTEGRLAGFPTYSTLQLASPAVIAERTGITVVADFRTRDIAAGGRGAPLVPLVDVLLYARPGHARALLNLGGIANLTLIPASNDPALVIGFDTGPANMPLDALMRLTSGGAVAFDRDGHAAAAGTVDHTLLQRLLAHPFVQMPPPRATGSEEFGEEFVATLLVEHPDVRREDLLATLVTFAAEAVADGLRRWFPHGETPQDVVASGGGTHNHTLMRALARALAPIPLHTIDEVGGQSDAKEAMAFAVLGYLTLRGRAGNLPSVTGAAAPVLLGSITPGRLGYTVLSPS